MLDELQRRAYLQAMGVECFAPRLQLPGAKPSVLCAMPVTPLAVGDVTPPLPQGVAADVAVGAAVPAPPAAGKSNAADILNLLGAESPEREVKRAAQASLESKPATTARTVPQFNLSIVRAGQVMIIDEGLAGEMDPQAYVRLLQNLLFALGVSVPSLNMEGFRWPMAKALGKHVDQSEPVAREALQAFLHKQLERDGSRILLLMGEQAQRYVAGQDVASGEWLSVAGLPARCLATASASKALQDASLKPVIWGDMQPVVTALKTH